jgi:hypothetical protein
MKQFIAFGGDVIPPRGGWNDFLGSFETENEALVHVVSERKAWYQVVDSLVAWPSEPDKKMEPPRILHQFGLWDYETIPSVRG